MKKLTTLLLACSAIASYAQPQLATDSIEINTIKATVYSDGGIWSMETLDDSTYKRLLFSDGLWLAGWDTNSNALHQSAQTYRQGGYDFVPGPVSNDPNAITKYDKVYRVNLQTLTDFKNGTTQGIPQEIADWPAHGDTNQGEAYYLAPFVDVNNDGHYKPADGDYPKIKGDEMIYTIINDTNVRNTVYTREGGRALGIEVHGMTYAYKTGGIEDSILFREYRIINRSNRDYTDAYLSIWMDYDLGTSWDDLTGTNIWANSVFVYNADMDDEGSHGFGQQPATCGLRILQGPPAPYFDGIDNDKDGCIDGVRGANGGCIPENQSTGVREHILLSGSMYYFNDWTPRGNPSSPGEFYTYAQSRWKNGNSLVIENPSGFLNVGNGDGYSTSPGSPTTFFYPGDTYDSTAAYEPSSPTNWFASPSNNGDVRSLANAGPFNLNAGEEFTLGTAYVWARNANPDHGYGEINKRLEGLDTIYDNQPQRTVGVNAYKVNSNFRLFYNAETSIWTINNGEKKELNFSLYNSAGQFVRQFEVDAHSKANVPTDGLSQGVYLIIEAQSGEAFKITR